MYKEKFKEIIRNVLNKYHDRVFYILNEEFITYGELLKRADRLSLYLRGDDSPVIVYGHKSIDMVVSFIGCILAGRSYIPVDIFTPLDRIDKIIELSNSTLVINNSMRKVLFSIDSISSIDNLEVNDEKVVNDNEDKLIKENISFQFVLVSGLEIILEKYDYNS